MKKKTLSKINRLLRNMHKVEIQLSDLNAELMYFQHELSNITCDLEDCEGR